MNKLVSLWIESEIFQTRAQRLDIMEAEENAYEEEDSTCDMVIKFHVLKIYQLGSKSQPLWAPMKINVFYELNIEDLVRYTLELNFEGWSDRCLN